MTVSKKTVVKIFVGLCLIFAAILFYALFIMDTNNTDALIRQYVLTEEVTRGQSLKGKYKEAIFPQELSVNKDILELDRETLDKSIAIIDLPKNSPLTKGVVRQEAVFLERKIEIAVPVTLDGSIANNVKKDDIVAVMISFTDKRPSAVVISSIPIKEVKSSNGTVVNDENTTVGYLIFDVTAVEDSDIKNAMKEGSIYVAKYNDLSAERLEKTYNVSETVLPNDGSNAGTDKGTKGDD